MRNQPYLLRKQDIIKYHEDGFVVPKYKFSGEKLQTLRRAASDLISHYPHIPTEGLVSPHIFYIGSNRPDIHDAFLDI